MIYRTLPFLALLACVSNNKFPIDTMDSAADTGDTDTIPRDPPTAETTAALPWDPELMVDGGTTGAASRSGFWVSDLAGNARSIEAEESVAHVYRVPWGRADGTSIQEAADVAVTTEAYEARIVDVDGTTLVISSADRDAGNYEINRMVEPDESGDLEDLVDLRVTFDDDGSTYWNNSTLLDADGDGAADDLVVAGRAAHGRNSGVIAVALDAPTSGEIRSTDMDVYVACEGRIGSDSAYGAMSVIADADGSVWVTCASSDRATGYAEHRPSLTASPDLLVGDVSGWSVVADPRGGVWLGSEGSGELVRADADGAVGRYAMNGFQHFGAGPDVIEAGGRIILAVGAMATSEAFASALYLYDVTDTTDLDTLTPNRLEPEGNVLCLGGVNALVAKAGGVRAASSGWLLDTREGCGIQMWELGE